MKSTLLILMITILLVGCSGQGIDQKTKTLEAEDENGNLSVSEEYELEVVEEVLSIIGQPIEYRSMTYTLVDWRLVPKGSTYIKDGVVEDISPGIYFVYDIDKGHDLDVDIASTVFTAYSYGRGDLGLADIASNILARMPYEAAEVVFPDYNITRLDKAARDNEYGNMGMQELCITGGISLNDWETPFTVRGKGDYITYEDILDIKNPHNIYPSN